MRQEFARFTDDRRIPIKCCVGFAGGFRCGVMLRRHVGHGKPLRFAVHTIERLYPELASARKRSARSWVGDAAEAAKRKRIKKTITNNNKEELLSRMI